MALTELQLRALRAKPVPGKYADRDGLYLRVSKAGCFHADVVALFQIVPDEVDVGWTENEDGTFNPPVSPPAEPPASPAPPPARRITKLAFRDRFTLAEKAAIDFASLDDPSAATDVRQQSAVRRACIADQEAASYIDLDRADTRTGVQQLETLGLIAAGRSAQVLDAEVETSERYLG
jgi:hypothetical protein